MVRKGRASALTDLAYFVGTKFFDTAISPEAKLHTDWMDSRMDYTVREKWAELVVHR